ncbi:MAG: hypothetical protein IZT56_10265 [Bacteroidetes bacterium]|nr:hypothetical protein [Bacteroidota bacterium]
MLKTRLIYILGLIICLSCNDKSSKSVTDFTVNSFSKHYTMTNGEFLLNDSIQLADPRWIRYHPDSFLVIQELGMPKMIKIIDLKTNKTQEILQKGKGPNEVINAWGINIVGKDIWVFGGQLKKFIKLSYDKNRQFYISDAVSFEDKNCMSGIALNDSVFVGMDLPSTNRLSFYNKKGKRFKTFGEFPPYLENDSKIDADNNIFKCNIIGVPTSNKLVLACNDIDVLEIYDSSKGLIKRLHGPKGIKVSARYVDIGIGKMIKTTPRIRAFNNVVANSKFFCVGYVGYETIKNERPKTEDVYPKNIFCFTWNGEPERSYSFDIPLISFDFDWEGKKIYALTITPEPQIVVFNIEDKI